MAKPKYEIEVLGAVLEDEEMSAWISRKEREAEEDIAAATVTLRWNKPQVDTVKRAAALFGIPYQTYLKQVVFRQALEDIAQAEPVLAAGVAHAPFTYPDGNEQRPQKRVAEE